MPMVGAMAAGFCVASFRPLVCVYAPTGSTNIRTTPADCCQVCETTRRKPRAAIRLGAATTPPVPQIQHNPTNPPQTRRATLPSMLPWCMLALSALAGLYGARRADRDAWGLATLAGLLAASMAAQRGIGAGTLLAWRFSQALFVTDVVALPAAVLVILARLGVWRVVLAAVAVVVVAAVTRLHGPALERLDIAASIVASLALAVWSARGQGRLSAPRVALAWLVVVDAAVMLASLGRYDAPAWLERVPGYAVGPLGAAVLLVGGLACRR